MLRVLLLLNFLALTALASSSSSKPPKVRQAHWKDYGEPQKSEVDRSHESDPLPSQYGTGSVGDYMTLSAEAQHQLWRTSTSSTAASRLNTMDSRANIRNAITESKKTADNPVTAELQRHLDKGLRKKSDKQKYTYEKDVAANDPRRVQQAAQARPAQAPAQHNNVIHMGRQPDHHVGTDLERMRQQREDRMRNELFRYDEHSRKRRH